MMDDPARPIRKPRRDEPCRHPGCLSHVSHPCEGCGRVWGRAWRGTGAVGGGGGNVSNKNAAPPDEVRCDNCVSWHRAYEKQLKREDGYCERRGSICRQDDSCEWWFDMTGPVQ